MARTKMSDDEKNARRAVREYLSALDDNKPKRGRKRTPESIDKRLAAIGAEMDDASALKKLDLSQERIDLQAEKDRLENAVDLGALEAGFVAHASAYGEAKGITYAAWREVGVSAETLKASGIKKGS